MSDVFFIADLHLGHKRILDFSPMRHGNTIEEHDDWIVSQWNSVVGRKDTVWILGDIAFTKEGLERTKELNGRKRAVLGNHDGFGAKAYMDAGMDVMPGVLRYKSMWLSHAPLHHWELRGCKNVHGHVHSETIPDDNYLNVSVENLTDGRPMPLQDVINWRGY